jgi:hypothetical protein
MQKQFLKKLKENWSSEFPFLKPIEVKEIPRRDKNCNFIYEGSYEKAGLAYFFSIQFSKIRIGEFTLDVSISNDKEHSILERKGKQDLSELKIGTYRIGSFFEKKDYWWMLVDVDRESYRLFESIGAVGSDLLKLGEQKQNRWQPSSFELPPDQIINEAIADVNKKLRLYVFPKCKIKC